MAKLDIIPAKQLREKATKKQNADETQLTEWVEDVAENITHWAEEDATNGQMCCAIKKEEFSDILPSNIPKEKMGLVLARTKDLLEKTYGYTVVLDQFNPKTNSADSGVYRITLNWGSPFNHGMEMPK